MPTQYRRVVASLHGIRTAAKWCAELAPLTAMRKAIPYLLNYGWFGALGMYIPAIRNARVRWLRHEYDLMVQRTGIRKPSIVAHSFGTWLLGELLNRYTDVSFDKVILSGSVLPPDFDWPRLIESGRITALHVEVATKDPWPVIADHVSWVLRPHVFGRSGVTGFAKKHPRVTENKQHISHSDMFYQTRYEMWLDFITKPEVLSEDLQPMVTVLWRARKEFARRLGLQRQSVRVALFVPSRDGNLYILHPELALGLNDAELGAVIPAGELSTGRAFKDNKIVAELKPRSKAVEGAPALSFVVGVPLRIPGGGDVVGVMTLDGVDGRSSIPAINQLRIAAAAASEHVRNAYVNNRSNGI
ncbi:MAG: hypothetical protein ING60_01225 [Rhodocyclaceae bacterium]|nr:hypothetical protein [Rhodocyclaceae bacterium]